MKKYTIKWPADFEDYSTVIEAKGWFEGIEIQVERKTLKPVFYDPTRLSQEINDAVSTRGFFLEPRLIVIKHLTRECIERAVVELARTGGLDRLA